MKLKQLASNMTTIATGDKVILFSYETPVAMMDVSGRFFVTEKKWSRTTSKHINKWIGDTGHNGLVLKPQEFFDELMK